KHVIFQALEQHAAWRCSFGTNAGCRLVLQLPTRGVCRGAQLHGGELVPWWVFGNRSGVSRVQRDTMGRASLARHTAAPTRAELDELTLRRAQQGERAALEALIDRYHPMVHRLVWRMACARGESHVADLVQDSLIRVLQGLAR